jgi:protein-disulfide isomerase
MVGGHQPAKLDLAGAPMAGATDAPVTVAVFACARCPHCSQLVPVLHDEILHGRLKGKARIAFLTFPIRGHPGSTEAGLAFTAAARMGQFWEFALHAYRHFNEFSPERQVEWARAMGLDPSVFSTLMADPATREMLVASKKQGVANGIEETPALFINGRRWVADLEAAELADAIEEEAAKLGGDIWTKP